MSSFLRMADCVAASGAASRFSCDARASRSSCDARASCFSCIDGERRWGLQRRHRWGLAALVRSGQLEGTPGSRGRGGALGQARGSLAVDEGPRLGPSFATLAPCESRNTNQGLDSGCESRPSSTGARPPGPSRIHSSTSLPAAQRRCTTPSPKP